MPVTIRVSVKLALGLYIRLWLWLWLITLLPCAVESHPTPGDIRGSSSPSRSISGVSSHVADGGSARVPHECVQPYLSWSSSPSRPIHSPEHHVIFHPSCSHHVPKVAFGTLDSSVHSGLMFSIIHMFVFLSIHDALSTLLQHHNSKASIFLLSCILIVQVSAP